MSEATGGASYTVNQVQEVLLAQQNMLMEALSRSDGVDKDRLKTISGSLCRSVIEAMQAGTPQLVHPQGMTVNQGLAAATPVPQEGGQ